MSNSCCPLCDAPFESVDDVYSICMDCGLNVKKINGYGEITNDNLSYQEIIKNDALTRFKLKLIDKFDSSKLGLLDVGTASGKLIYHAKSLFKNVQGVEVNTKCIEFAVSKLGTKVVPTIEQIDLRGISIVTFWHSLEHIPLNESKLMILKLYAGTDAKILISVPNAGSLQFKLFQQNWPYYDKYSHLYQFSSKSLVKLFDQCGYKLVASKIGFAYELFGFWQGFVNLLHPIPNYFYYRKKRGWNFGKPRRILVSLDAYNLLLLTLALPFSLVMTLLSFLRNEGVINYVFEKK